MKTLSCILITAIEALRPATAQDFADTIVTYAQPPVTVHASRLMPRSTKLMANRVRLEGWSLRRMDGRTIDAVLESEGGLLVRDIGGPGGVKSVSLRNSPSTQTVFQMNGMRLNHPQNSMVDIGLYPVALFDAVEVARGGQSAFLGADAHAGAVMLGLWPSQRHRLMFDLGGGSFGQVSGALRWDEAGERIMTSIRAGFDRSDGRFSFPWPGPSGTITRTREGAMHKRWFGAASAVVPAGPMGHLEGTILGVSALRGSPGPVTAGPPAEATLRDGVLHGVFRWVSVQDERTGWEVGLSASLQDEAYEEATLSVSDRYESRVASGWAHWQGAMSDAWGFGLGLEASTATLDSRNILPNTRRTSGAVLAHIEWTGTSVRVLPTLRADITSDQRPFISPRLAVELPIVSGGRLTGRANVGSGMRMPNFNELYWRPGGDPLLRPERILTAEAGLHAQLPEHGVIGAIAIFAADTRDRITGWPPVNLAHTVSWGIDGNGTWSLAGHRWWLSGTFSNVESRSPPAPGCQVPFLPRWIASSGMDLEFGPLMIGPSVRYISRRFTTLENVAALSVPPSTRFSVAGRLRLRVSQRLVIVRCAVDNALNVSESSIPGYPLPGRSVTLSATVELNEKSDKE